MVADIIGPREPRVIGVEIDRRRRPGVRLMAVAVPRLVAPLVVIAFLLSGVPAPSPAAGAAAGTEKKAGAARDLGPARELAVGRDYTKNRDYVAAINRFKVVVIQYPNAPEVTETLMRLTEVYLALGIAEGAQTAAAVLGRRFPDSPWRDKAYSLLKSKDLEPLEDESSWISHAFK
jgi:hypothetical protein